MKPFFVIIFIIFPSYSFCFVLSTIPSLIFPFPDALRTLSPFFISFISFIPSLVCISVSPTRHWSLSPTTVIFPCAFASNLINVNCDLLVS